MYTLFTAAASLTSSAVVLLGSPAAASAAPSITAPSITAPSITAPSITAPSITADVTSAQVMGKGAGVTVTLSVTCPAAQSGAVYLSITQRSGNGIARGGLSTFTVCTGAAQAVTLPVIAEGTGRPFKQGTAIVSILLETCNDLGCSSSEDNETVAVTR